jgi:hypothetical protein
MYYQGGMVKEAVFIAVWKTELTAAAKEKEKKEDKEEEKTDDGRRSGG